MKQPSILVHEHAHISNRSQSLTDCQLEIPHSKCDLAGNPGTSYEFPRITHMIRMQNLGIHRCHRLNERRTWSSVWREDYARKLAFSFPGRALSDYDPRRHEWGEGKWRQNGLVLQTIVEYLEIPGKGIGRLMFATETAIADRRENMRSSMRNVCVFLRATTLRNGIVDMKRDGASNGRKQKKELIQLG
jgi:hypothetical protein